MKHLQGWSDLNVGMKVCVNEELSKIHNTNGRNAKIIWYIARVLATNNSNFSVFLPNVDFVRDQGFKRKIIM